jgi:hypothetical protein
MAHNLKLLLAFVLVDGELEHISLLPRGSPTQATV